MVVFFDRGNFFLVHELNSPLFSTEYEDIKFGSSDSAFDSFDLVFHSLNGHKVTIFVLIFLLEIISRITE